MDGDSQKGGREKRKMKRCNFVPVRFERMKFIPV